MTRVIIGPALVPRSPHAGGISLRMFALICSFLLSAMMWSGLFFLISGCAELQPACAACYIGLQQLERSK
ncbi:hypothetical protein [Rhizobium sp. CC-YZS058]|uniref:hypothetical protein n=1 Tax=Rhizobium sp. CC-YZS058 TaxID=3042153 RepID=UPI002B05992D|nr:hypothetical protein [Rhizobium sp. CC-YZS058]MEA3533700.1 hypothetical protein [Rhizobium sp. CC-YZS058]